MTDQWPRNTLAPKHCSVNKAYRSTSGGVSLSGYERSVASDAGVWVGSYSEFPVPTPQMVLLWRALESTFSGRQNSMLIPIYESIRAPVVASYQADKWLNSGGQQNQMDQSGVPHSDGTLHSDGTGYYSSGIDVVLDAEVAMRGVFLTLGKRCCGDIQPGHRFSIGERLFEVDKIVSQTSTVANVKVWPPSREAFAAGSFADFVNPVLKAKLTSDQGMDLRLEWNRYGFPTIEFIEETL